MIVALESLSLPAEQELPKRLLVAPWGHSKSVKGPVVVNETTLAELPGNQVRANFARRVALDFQHNTVPETDAYKAEKEPRRVAAFGVPRVVAGEGVYLEQLEWTPEGREAYSGKHYPDLSPAVAFNARGEVVFLHSAALVRQGAIPGLHAFVSNFDPFRNLPMKDKLLKLLGLKADATDAEIDSAADQLGQKLTAFSALEQKVAAFAASIEQLTSKLGDVEKGVAAAANSGNVATQISAFSAEIKNLTTKVDGFSARADAAEREILVRDAMQAGKIVPFGALEKLSIADAKALLAELPAGQVPTERRTPEGVKAFSSAVTNTADAVQTEINRKLGIKPEVYAKHNPAA
ncbi:hypothetical protein ASA1KI_21210 [Opitutales bacterium ASA1]|uniref:phage protease n=1 Tax=Congregicoccus parvus TaxID=3081749 RepID=UPI002B2A9DB1|nr:hypothetical protein ASA1KI_21210 [Opitutales bacterium ASA1]